MRKPDFEKCTSEATKLLYQQDVSNRILNIQNLTYDKNIIFESIQNYSQYTQRPISDFLSVDKQMLRDGCMIYIPDKNIYLVLYNDFCKQFERQNWTLAHEIGHIYMKHAADGDTEEVEAHFFASQLFMPEYSLFMMKKEYEHIDVNAITEIFGVSEDAAARRIRTMNRKHCVKVTQRDKKIWNAQRERIDMYYDCLRNGSDYRNTLLFWNKMKAEYKKQCQLEAYF